LRFIFYAIPLLNLVVAVELSSLFEKKQKFIFGVCFLGLFVSMMISGFILYVSSMNYYGGDALMKLHDQIPKDGKFNIHIDPESAMNGINRFLELKNHKFD
jgi:alpha-1,6-mannosyltransferase